MVKYQGALLQHVRPCTEHHGDNKNKHKAQSLFSWSSNLLKEMKYILKGI